ncbi:37S ribosomal protein S9, mitochondrial [Lecanora helva]
MSCKTPWRLIRPPPLRCPECHRLPYYPLLRRQHLSTTPNTQPVNAAAPIDLSNLPAPNPLNARIVPASPSYFTTLPDATDNYLTLLALLRRYQTLPTVPPGQAPRVAWRTTTQYRLLVGENVRAAKYNKIIQVLQRLNRIHPSVMPGSLKEAMQIYKRDVDPYAVTKRPNIIDEAGRACGVGRRKSSSAKVYLVQGEGEVLVNGKGINSAFGRIHDRESALWALKATGRIGKYNVWALVTGGGSTGQAEAITLGAAKALMVFEPGLKPALRRGGSFFYLSLFLNCADGEDEANLWIFFAAGCVTRDPRRVERKKPGKVKARKMPAWVKR